MKKTWIIGLLVLAVLISGCTYGPETTPQQTAAQPAPTTPATTQPATTQPATAPGATAAVEIKGFAFNPATITIAKGTIVTWTNRDGAPHTVTGTGNDINSQTLSQGQAYSFTFNDAGTFEYKCNIHPSMRGKVIVT
ncbi:MAG: cupredoxin family copper-binding protein [Candidatus Methanoperedens sp.]